jgi:hypothetical protein
VVIVFIISLTVYNSQVAKLGTIKVQTTNVTQEEILDMYPVDEVLTLKATQYLDVATLAGEIGGKPVLGRPDGFPTDYAQYTSDQKQWLKDYLCGAVKVKYIEIDTYDELGSTSTTTFQLDCSVHTIVDDLYHMHFEVSVNTEGEIQEYSALSGLTLSQGSTRNMAF